MAFRVLLSALLVTPGFAQSYSFCHDGIGSLPDVYEDWGAPSIEVIVAQAPLFSTNPKIGQKGKYLNLYHTALVLRQIAKVCTNGRYWTLRQLARLRQNDRYWTLEFKTTASNIMQANSPFFEANDQLVFNQSAARFCLTEGLLWGQDHWRKSFETVATLTTRQLLDTFHQVVLPSNSSDFSQKPHYQLWRVEPSTEGKAPQSVEDVTCATGVQWFLSHLFNNLGLPKPREDFEFWATRIYVRAETIREVDTSDSSEWQKIVKNFHEQWEVVGGGIGILARLRSFSDLMPVKYVYDTNAGVYYEITGNRLPFFGLRYKAFPLLPSPFALQSVVNVF